MAIVRRNCTDKYCPSGLKAVTRCTYCEAGYCLACAKPSMHSNERVCRRCLLVQQ